MHPAKAQLVPSFIPTPLSSDVSSKPEGENPKAHVVTGLLQAWGAGDASALDALFPIVYGELRQRASHVLGRESVGHTLQPTALVHEAYLRLVDQRVVRWEGRTQFFALAARVMRRVLVDHARARLAGKRGAGANHVTLIETALSSDASNGESIDSIDLLALDDALVRLAAFDARKARLVELRYFAGLSIPQAAESLGISQATVIREWSVARRWLHRELSE